MKKLIAVFVLFLFPIFGSLSFAESSQTEVKFSEVEEDLFPTWSGGGTEAERKLETYDQTKFAEYEELKSDKEEKEKIMEDLMDELFAASDELEAAKLAVDEADKVLKKCKEDKTCKTEKQGILNAKEAAKTEADEKEAELLSKTDLAGVAFEDAEKKANDLLSRFAVDGVLGTKEDGKLLMHYLPNLVNILLKFVSPVVVIVLIYSGIRFIYAGDNEEELGKAKSTFMYAFVGVLIIVLSYSIMKALYFFLAS